MPDVPSADAPVPDAERAARTVSQVPGERARERLDVVAALLTYDAARSDEADAWVRADGTPLGDAEQNLIGSATDEEWALAEGLLGGPDVVSDPDAPAMAALLRLASGTDVASLLRAGLRQAFLHPDGSGEALEPGERTAAFAGLFRTLALPALNAAAREMAGPLLDALGPCD
jgi:hypothetical protein